MENNITSHHKLIILGSGPAGYTAAIYASRANLQPLLFTGTNPGGQLVNTHQIENWPGDFKKLTGLELMNRMHDHAKLLNTNILFNEIKRVNFKQLPFLLVSDTNEKFTCDSLIIATGSSPKYLGLSTETKFLGHGVSTCAVCDGFFYKNKIVAVVGGGNTAVEEALYLSNIARTVHLIHRRNIFKAEKRLIAHLLKKVGKNIILHKQCTVNKILGDKSGVTGINIINKNFPKQNIMINISGIFIAIGNIPNTNIFHDQLLMSKNYIVIQSGIHENSTQTNIPGIFAAGDVVDHVYRQAITSSASGCMAALDAEKFLDKKYSL